MEGVLQGFSSRTRAFQGRATATSATTLSSLALVRASLAIVTIGGYGLRLRSANSSATIPSLAFVLLGIVALVSAIRTIVQARRDPEAFMPASWAMVIFDAIIAIAVLGAVEASTTPLSWLALLFPVIEAALFFSIMPAAIVWAGLSMAFLALRLTVQADDQATSEALSLAIQQLVAVFVISGPAALLSDRSQSRVEQLDRARRDADEIADELRRVSWASNEMSQSKDPNEILQMAVSTALSMGFEQADVVEQRGLADWSVTHASSVGPLDVPPAELLTDATIDAPAVVSDQDSEAWQFLHTNQLHSGLGQRITSPERDPQIVLRVWARKTVRGTGSERALNLLGSQTRELHRVALLLRDAQQHAAQLQHEIRHDGLTGLANRSWVLENLGQRLGRGERTAVYFIDLDGFKNINDTLGHRAGDDALRVVARRLEATTADTTLVGRMGGDEFILVVEADGNRDLEALGNDGLDIVATISEPMIAAGQEARLGASVGLAVQTSHGLDADQLVTRADTAMYTAKRAGGGVHVASTRLGGEMAA